MTEKPLPQALYPFLDSIKEHPHSQEGRCEWDLCLEAVKNWAEAYSGHESRLRPCALTRQLRGRIMTKKPMPQALYPCHFCGEEYSHSADELFWSPVFNAWVCDNCWRDQPEHCKFDEEKDLFCEYGISLENELRNRQRIRFSKSIEDAPVDTPVLALLADGTIHTAIKRQGVCTYDKSVLARSGLPPNWSVPYFYFDIAGTVDTETQEPCYVGYEEVAGFAPIPEIVT